MEVLLILFLFPLPTTQLYSFSQQTMKDLLDILQIVPGRIDSLHFCKYSIKSNHFSPPT